MTMDNTITALLMLLCLSIGHTLGVFLESAKSVHRDDYMLYCLRRIPPPMCDAMARDLFEGE